MKDNWITFPCNVDKSPKVESWGNMTKSVKLKDGDDSYGVLTGRLSGICVIDIDVREDGIQNWMKLTDIPLGEIEKLGTMVVKTGGGGYHVYFKFNRLWMNHWGSPNNIVRGVDIRTDGGYVIGPGSLHKSGKTYDIVDPSKEITTMPVSIRFRINDLICARMLDQMMSGTSVSPTHSLHMGKFQIRVSLYARYTMLVPLLDACSVRRHGDIYAIYEEVYQNNKLAINYMKRVKESYSSMEIEFQNNNDQN